MPESYFLSLLPDYLLFCCCCYCCLFLFSQNDLSRVLPNASVLDLPWLVRVGTRWIHRSLKRCWQLCRWRSCCCFFFCLFCTLWYSPLSCILLRQRKRIYFKVRWKHCHVFVYEANTTVQKHCLCSLKEIDFFFWTGLEELGKVILLSQEICWIQF